MGTSLDPLGRSACWVAAARAAETEHPERLFQDPWAHALSGEEGWRGLAVLARTSPDNPGLALRTRYFDDYLTAATRAGIEQVVLLAAGMDTRAFRLDWSAASRVFEFDRPAVLEHKARILDELGAVSRAARVAVAGDLQGEFAARLIESGFVPSKPAAFLLEGLLVYLPDEQAVVALLRQVWNLAAPGSQLGFDVVGDSFLDSPLTLPYREALRELGTAWHFGTDNPEALVQRCGFEVTQVVEPWEVDYGRWKGAKFPRSLLGIPRSYLVHAHQAVAR